VRKSENCSVVVPTPTNSTDGPARSSAARAPVVQLQQTDGMADHHSPFTPETNAAGIIEPAKVLAALDRSGAAYVTLVLEIIPPFEEDDDQVLEDLRQSAAYWRAGLRDHAGG
jgi:hypothetical protein